MTTSYVSIYWFFPAIWVVYLCIPLFSSIEKARRKETFSYLLVIGFSINALLPFLFSMANTVYDWPLNIPVVSDALWYAVCGYMLVHYPPEQKTRRLLYALSAAGFLLHVLGTYFSSIQAGEVVTRFKGYYSPACCLYSVGVFLLLQQWGQKLMASKASKWITWFAKYTMAIYLVHYYVINVVVAIFDLNSHTIPFVLLSPLWIIVLSILTTAIVRKIPLLRHTLPE